MPATYPDYPCQVCGNSHTLYFPGGGVPDLSRPLFYTCTALPVAMRVTRGDSWKPVKESPAEALMVQCGDGAGRAVA
jgi:hypothetical protein